jgi:hypothetical protein
MHSTQRPAGDPNPTTGVSGHEWIKPAEWFDYIQTMRFRDVASRHGVSVPTVRNVAYTLATYADYKTGDRIKPGLATLSVAAECDVRTARTVLKILRELGLIVCTRRSRSRDHADEYRLAVPDDITDRITVLSPTDLTAAADKIRSAERRPPRTGVNRPRTPTHPLPVPPTPVEDPVPVTPTPVATPTGTGVGGTANPGCTGVAGTAVQVSPTPAIDPVTDTTRAPTHSSEDLSTAVTLPRVYPRDEPLTGPALARAVLARLGIGKPPPVTA